ncbi:uncharacterized protein SPAPADRAFT_157322 [Spathaspora passalidarum NRRL Y-27907]|uniref:DNA polymerase gamma n=1 Tax=Spathaspora passalidarum (strain NRRL Y-27907 / 11-Y1) TaxID=619300 RepID=G3AU03_SPAPN|nr:uncharacterized protein SPAPADRAFT_157322 [Spathaspora passalidarum NRRL Y-27907]EGW30379.1 hypothetical protein SPAPADRAFT_157322 [Spathaspora passalidarum NRRL Y-27907]
MKPIRTIRPLLRSQYTRLCSQLRHTTSFSTFSRCQQETIPTTSDTAKEEPRVNQLGIQYLSNDLHKKLFPTTSPQDYLKPKYPELIDISENHLSHNELLGKRTQITDPITIKNFPELMGDSLDEHFHKLAQRSSNPYLSMCEEFLTAEGSGIPPRPDSKNWLFQAGWTRYTPDGPPESVDFPLENELVFDVEVMYKISQYPVMATCASSKAWYGWVSPVLLDIAEKDKKKRKINWEHLIPMNCAKHRKLIIGYNVSYDRARIRDEYNIKQTKAFYLDGMSLHVAISGICSRQRPKWQKHRKNQKISDDGEFEHLGLTEEELKNLIVDEESEDPWLKKGAPNSLANVAEFHCGIKMDKTDRDYFASEDPQEVIDNFHKLMDYCARDVEATYIVTKKLFPEFRQRVPHPVSFAALRHMGSLILPTTTKWNKYIESANSHYYANREKVTESLKQRAVELVEYIEKQDDNLMPDHESDPWLSQLNWEIKQPRMKKDGTPWSRQAFMTGYPEWYRDLFKKEKGNEDREMNLTLRTRTAPLFLRLKWEGYPIFWVDSQGWCFKVPYNADIIDAMAKKNYHEAKLTKEEIQEHHDVLRGGNGEAFVLFKIPHPDGAGKRCTSVLSKNFIQYFENGTLTSEFEYAREIMTLNNEASYWMGNRNRIMEQFVVFSKEGLNNFFPNKEIRKEHKNMGIIIPMLATMGTITRRATENTWLTASNAKKNRIGSELKSLIEAPQGYCFVGADVDSEELWIASLVGDSMFQTHGGTALGWMTLEGEKSQKTDLHSKTASILGISRNDAKVFNYGRIYGAGVTFATRLLKQFNKDISDNDAETMAKKLYASTKGQSKYSKHFNGKLYFGGSESIMFNALEAIAQQEEPRTPVLGASITDALNAKNLKKNNYMTSRVNWTIQSSGVDYLHLLIVAMDYLIEEYKVDARLMITVHDELRYLVKEEDKYKVALLLQIANVWTRAMFCEQLGIKEVPQSCAFFSEVDIDHVLRKEVGMDCVTPSNPNPIPKGESLDIRKLLEICGHGEILENVRRSRIRGLYSERTPIISGLDSNLNTKAKIAKIRLQTSVDEDEWKKNLRLFGHALKQEDPRDETKNGGSKAAQTKKKSTKVKRTKTSRSNDEYPSTTERSTRTTNVNHGRNNDTAVELLSYRERQDIMSAIAVTEKQREGKYRDKSYTTTGGRTKRKYPNWNMEPGRQYVKEEFAESPANVLEVMAEPVEFKSTIFEPSIDELYARSIQYSDVGVRLSQLNFEDDPHRYSRNPHSQHHPPFRRADLGPSSEFKSHYR